MFSGAGRLAGHRAPLPAGRCCHHTSQRRALALLTPVIRARQAAPKPLLAGGAEPTGSSRIPRAISTFTTFVPECIFGVDRLDPPPCPWLPSYIPCDPIQPYVMAISPSKNHGGMHSAFRCPNLVRCPHLFAPVCARLRRPRHHPNLSKRIPIASSFST